MLRKTTVGETLVELGSSPKMRDAINGGIEDVYTTLIYIEQDDILRFERCTLESRK